MKAQGAYNLLFRAGLRRDFRDQFNLYPLEYPSYLRVGTMDGPEIEASAITGPNRLIERGDLEPVTFFDAKLAGKAVGIDKEFAGAFAVSQKTVEDDKYNKANQGAKWLGDASRVTREYRSAALLDDAFTGSIYKGIDGLALCHTAHVLFGALPGVTMANRPAQDIGFSVAGVNALLELHELHKNWNGDPVKSVPDKLIISPKYVGMALQLFGTDKEPWTATNEINQVRKRISTGEATVSRYKTSVESYFLVDSRQNDAQFLQRVGISMKDWIDESTWAMCVAARERYCIWFFDFHGWTGTLPT